MSFLGDAETIPGVSGNEEVSTGVETDGQLRGRHIVVTRSLVPLAGRSQHDVPEACLLYTSPSPRDGLLSRMPSSA